MNAIQRRGEFNSALLAFESALEKVEKAQARQKTLEEQLMNANMQVEAVTSKAKELGEKLNEKWDAWTNTKWGLWGLS